MIIIDCSEPIFVQSLKNLTSLETVFTNSIFNRSFVSACLIRLSAFLLNQVRSAQLNPSMFFLLLFPSRRLTSSLVLLVIFSLPFSSFYFSTPSLVFIQFCFILLKHKIDKMMHTELLNILFTTKSKLSEDGTWIVFMWLGRDSLMGCCKHGSEHSDYCLCPEFHPWFPALRNVVSIIAENPLQLPA